MPVRWSDPEGLLTLSIPNSAMGVQRALPVAQGLTPWLNDAERELAQITAALADSTEADEPALLDRLTQDFVEAGFDVRHTLRLIRIPQVLIGTTLLSAFALVLVLR